MDTDLVEITRRGINQSLRYYTCIIKQKLDTCAQLSKDIQEILEECYFTIVFTIWIKISYKKNIPTVGTYRIFIFP